MTLLANLRGLRSCVLCAPLALFVACASDIDADDDGDPQDPGPGASRIQTQELDGGVFETHVDATSEEDWVYFDIDTGEELVLTEAEVEPDTDWDLAFQRVNVKINRVVTAPTLADWYDYDQSTHVVSPKEMVHTIRSGEGRWFSLEFLDYYDDAGTSGHLRFEWQSTTPPDRTDPTPDFPDDAFEVDASNREMPVYVKLSGEAASADDWDILFIRAEVRSNSGTSGDGLAGVQLAPADTRYDALTETDTVGFLIDEMLPGAGPPGTPDVSGNAALHSWYDYDASTHQVNARPDDVYIVRSGNGERYGKLAILAWSEGVFTVRIAPIDRTPQLHESAIDASDASVWVYFDFDSADTLEVETPEDDPRWDLALRRTALRTNSGTSGTGQGGALETEAATVDALSAVPDGDAQEDAMVPLPGPPGSGEISGSPVLGTWFDYDPMSHAVSPRAAVFAIRTGDGAWVKLQVTGWEDGVFTLAWSHAGPAHADF